MTLYPDLAAIVERVWGVVPDGFADRIDRRVDSKGLWWRVWFVDEHGSQPWGFRTPTDPTDAAALELMWRMT